MHKGVILLVKASDKEEALSEVESFLEPYGEGFVWDWYQIGGRWNNTLAPKDKQGNNNYCDHYSLPEYGNVYDIVPLKDCIDVVKEWCKDLDKEREELWDKLVQAKEEAKEGKWDSTGYLAGQYRDAHYGNFCFDSNVYNVTEGLAEDIPDNIEEYFAVMVDMHN